MQAIRHAIVRLLPHHWQRWLAAGVLCLVLLALHIWDALPATRQAAALRRWNANSLANYRLTVKQRDYLQVCEQQVEVRAERVTRVLKNNCLFAARWTASELFRRVDRLQATEPRCATTSVGTGCICRSSQQTLVAYDETYGLPRSIQSGEIWFGTWESGAFWRYLSQSFALPDCNAPFDGLEQGIAVTEITPLPAVRNQ